MERLTQRNDVTAYVNCDNCPSKGSCNIPQSCLDVLANKLSAYEDAEERGRLVILPCKVGDTVWDRRGEPWTVISVEWFSRKVTHLHCKSPVTGRGMMFSLGKRSLGKTVFLAREEAEKALEGMK